MRIVSYDGMVDLPYEKTALIVSPDFGANSLDIEGYKVSAIIGDATYHMGSYRTETEALCAVIEAREQAQKIEVFKVKGEKEFTPLCYYQF